MKDKYNMKIVWDYINKMELENVKELEDDPKFMMQVIRATRDKKRYDLCSDNVKKDYEFIKFMINLFRKDKEFINKVASDYLEKTSFSSLNHQELICIMASIFNDYSELGLMYNIEAISIYHKNRLRVDIYIRSEQDIELRKQMGLGFCLILDSNISNSKIMLRYFASKYVEEIFYGNRKYNLEELMHKNIAFPSVIKEKGIKNFILDYIKVYDQILADFLSTNIDLLDSIATEIIRIFDNWNNYNNNIIEQKRWILEQETNQLINEHNASITLDDALSYIDKLGITNMKLSTYPCNEETKINIKNIDFNTYYCLTKIVKLAKELYSSPIIEKVKIKKQK